MVHTICTYSIRYDYVMILDLETKRLSKRLEFINQHHECELNHAREQVMHIQQLLIKETQQQSKEPEDLEITLKETKHLRMQTMHKYMMVGLPLLKMCYYDWD